MRVVINGLYLIPNRVGGSETYLRGLMHGLAADGAANEYIVSLGREALATFQPPDPRWRIVASPAASAQRAVRLALEQLWIPRLASALQADVIHSPGYTGPLASRQSRVTTIHDMNYKRHPEDLSLAERAMYSMLIPQVARRSHQVIAGSQAARSDIVQWTGVHGSKVSVVYYAAPLPLPGDPREDAPRLAAAHVEEPFVLSVAAAYPHKNLERLVQAFPLETRTGDTPTRLVLVGLGGRAAANVRVAVDQRRDVIQVLGWVDDALLGSLYRRALALAFPSLYEGFGLPILEAMSAGTPVLTSNFGAMVEIANGAAELIDPRDVNAIRDGLQRLTRDHNRREELRGLGLRRAAEFSWERTAQATLAVYDAAVRAGR